MSRLFEPGQVIHVCLDGVGEFQKEASAVRSGHALPRGKRLARSGYGAIDVGGAGRRYFGDHAVVVGIVIDDASAFERIDELAADEQPGLDLEARFGLGRRL